MEAREFLDAAKDAGLILPLAHYVGSKCVGRGQALVVDPEGNIAVMLENCGDPADTGIRAGDIVGFFRHPEAEPRITGSPASVRA
jgi:hypothetical protein